MAEKYDILQWYSHFVKSGDEFNIKDDAQAGSSVVLYPGRFYILKYKSKTDKIYNCRPVIISLGMSEKYPDSYLCIDLCVMPLKETNDILKQNGNKTISFSTLKRYLKDLKSMSDDAKKEMYDGIENEKIIRKQDLLDALESSEEDSRKVRSCKKRLKQVNIKIKEGI